MGAKTIYEKIRGTKIFSDKFSPIPVNTHTHTHIHKLKEHTQKNSGQGQGARFWQAKREHFYFFISNTRLIWRLISERIYDLNASIFYIISLVGGEYTLLSDVSLVSASIVQYFVCTTLSMFYWKIQNKIN